jgi:hypothetical protein
VKKYGKILERTTYDGNVIEYKGSWVAIYTTDRYGNRNGMVSVDVADYPKIEGMKICKTRNGYAVTRLGNRVVSIHRLILDVPHGFDTDHINHDRLDNRRGNIRICTPSQNNMNKKTAGITWDKKRQKWVAQINLHGKTVNLGRFNSKDTALAARKQAEKRMFGEFAYDRD